MNVAALPLRMLELCAGTGMLGLGVDRDVPQDSARNHAGHRMNACTSERPLMDVDLTRHLSTRAHLTRKPGQTLHARLVELRREVRG